MQASSYKAQGENKFLVFMFSLWVLSLPFYQFDIIGTLSVDNLLAPLVFLLWVLASITGPASVVRNSRMFLLFILIGLYSLFNVISLVISASDERILSAASIEARYMLYLLLPIMCIRTVKVFKFVLKLFVLDTVIVCLSAFFQAIGLIHLDFARSIAGNRLDTNLLVRSPGLFESYGDVAILIAFAGVVIYCCHESSKGRKMKIVKFLFAISLLVGAVAAQSRNVIIAVLVVTITFAFLRKLEKISPQKRGFYLFTALSVGLVVIPFVYLIVPYVYSLLLGSGGVKMSVTDRFAQYDMAFSLISQNPIFGIGGDAELKYAVLVSQIHNLWLGVALKGGSLAVIMLAWMFVKGIGEAFSRISNKVVGKEAALMVALGFGMLTSSMFYVAQGSYIFWTMFGVLLCFHCLVDVDDSYIKVNKLGVNSNRYLQLH